MLVLWIGALVPLICITYWVYHWRNPRCNGKLPPGSMGFPLLGETLQFFSRNTTNDIAPFLKERMKRYGPVFKTSIVGQPVIVLTDPDLNHFVFLQEGQLFQSWYPDTFTKILGRQNMIFDLTAKKLISYDQDNASQNLRENFVAFIKGLLSFPLDIPAKRKAGNAREEPK